jgi:sulfotransferase family protein
MASRVKGTSKPIFIVGSGRSGSTILTWCLGQHPNIIPQEESNWLGPFAIDAAIGYQRGSARGERGQLSANFIQREELLSLLGDSINKLILSHRNQFENMNLRRQAGWDPLPFNISSSGSEPKSRWVDSTPEYSFYICGLRKLFPQALFVHLVRDVTAVVRSLLNFFPDGRNRLVANEQAAYEYWLRKVTACVEAEQAYGPDVVYRMRYSHIIKQPEAAMRSLLDFLGEPYAPQCLEPFAQRINSANVPGDFNAHDTATNPAIVERARKFSDQLQNSPQVREISAELAKKMETEFDHQVEYYRDLRTRYNEAQLLIAKLQQRENGPAAVVSAETA